MPTEIESLEAAIAALEGQRALLGDAVVDAALGPMRSRLGTLRPTRIQEPPQTLRQVTVLFLDVVGSTHLSQYLDPEDLHAVMDSALARFTEVVQSHGGKVLNYAGDSVLAVFGIDEANEDDVERAIRCGLALLQAGRDLGARVLSEHGHAGFDVRVGIHTGGVLVGDGVDGEGSIRGLTVNVAARMEQTAPPGALRISHDAYRHVRGVFDVEVQPPIAVKGVDEPIQTYLVERAKPRAFRVANRGIEGVETRMIGREAELEHLKEAFRRSIANRRLMSVMVSGEAGVGKSRLLHEFENWAEAEPDSFRFFQGRASPHTENQPFGLLRDILAWRLQISDEATMASAREKLEAGIVPLFVVEEGRARAESYAHLLGHLIGLDFRESPHLRGILDDPKQIRNRAFHALAQTFRRTAAKDDSPIVLQLDDLHWADNETLDFLEYLREVNEDVPLLIIGLTRPALFDRRPDWHRGAENWERLNLQPLDKALSRSLAEELLKKLPEVPTALRELITGSAEGNPFYMEELVKMLIDQGAIDAGADRWILNADRLISARVPPTLTGVLQARLDGLPALERHALQAASIIGQVFWDEPLSVLDPRAREALPGLVKREIALAGPDLGSDGLREYAFKNQILHQVTYDTVLKRTRRDLHGRLAVWLARLSGLRANDFLALTAENYEKAGDDARAVDYRVRAAEHALSRFAHDGVLSHVHHALALLDRQSEEDRSAPAALAMRWRLLDVRVRTLDLQGSRPEQRADLDVMDALAEALDDDSKRAHVAWRRGTLAMRTSDWQTEAAAARRGAMLAEHTGEPELRLRCLRLLADATAHQGDWREGQALAEATLAEARSLGLRDVESACLNTLATIANDIRDDPVSALPYHRKSLEIDREIGDRRGEAVALANIGAMQGALGAVAEALNCLPEALELVRANGDRNMECVILSNIAALEFWSGKEIRARSAARAAHALAVAVEAPNFQILSRIYLGHAELALGRQAEAVEAYEEARRIAKKGDLPFGLDATAALARAALQSNDIDGAMREVELLLAHWAAQGRFAGTCEPRLLELICYQVLVAAGDSRAAEWLERAHTNLMSTADTISDAALREEFLANIPHNREISAAWKCR